MPHSSVAGEDEDFLLLVRYPRRFLDRLHHREIGGEGRDQRDATPTSAPAYVSRCSMLAAAHAATAASTMMAPCDRLSTPETPKIRVKPVAPSA